MLCKQKVNAREPGYSPFPINSRPALHLDFCKEGLTVVSILVASPKNFPLNFPDIFGHEKRIFYNCGNVPGSGIVCRFSLLVKEQGQ